MLTGIQNQIIGFTTLKALQMQGLYFTKVNINYIYR